MNHLTNKLKKLIDNVESKKLGATGQARNFNPEFPESFGPFLTSANQKIYNLSQIYSANIFGQNHPLEFVAVNETKDLLKSALFCYDSKYLSSLATESIQIANVLDKNLGTSDKIKNLTNIYGHHTSAFPTEEAAIIELNQNVFVSNRELNFKQTAHPIARYFFEFFVKNNEIAQKNHTFIKEQLKSWKIDHKLLGRFLFLNLSPEKQEALFHAGVLGQNRQIGNYNIYFSFPYCMKPVEIVEAIHLIKVNC
ncbi:MAG: hypothetical protein JNM93_03435 [Bacteriovoracaceae bacterium]|nr:hypothetical protein [Bacteriovoracaceae bacterium]